MADTAVSVRRTPEKEMGAPGPEDSVFRAAFRERMVI
jgi:hypothetical protein